MTTLSANAQAVLNTISNSVTTACGDPKLMTQNCVYTSASSSVPPIVNSGSLGTVQTSESLPSVVTITLPNTNSGYTWITTPNGWGQTAPYIGDPIPNWGGGMWPPVNDPPPFAPQPTVYPPIKIIPDLESLEEGVHDIPGGKVIIKKIKVTEEELEKAIEDTLGPEVSEEEKAKVKQELEDMAASEEREV